MVTYPDRVPALVDVGVDVAVGAVGALDVRPQALDVEVHFPADILIDCYRFTDLIIKITQPRVTCAVVFILNTLSVEVQ